MRKMSVVNAGLVAVFLSSVASPSPVMADPVKSWDKLSTALAFGVIGSAAYTTFSKPDAEGHTEFLKAMATTLVATEALKAIFPKNRPDGSGNDSFPSGHTSMAFAAATYFDIRYGDQYKTMVPIFYGAAALTAVGRVKANKHTFEDVAAGALIGVALAHTFTTQPDGSGTVVYPTGDGVGMTYTKKF